MIRVLIADDHAVVRQGLRTYLELQDDVEVVARGGRRRGGGRGGRARSRPTSCCSTWRCRGSTASPRCATLRERAPGARVIVLTSFGEDDRLFAALRARRRRLPAQGHRAGRARPRDPHGARRASRRSRPPSRRAWSRSWRAAAARARSTLLTPRELEVLRLIARGRSNKRIALELGVAEKTVKTHVGHVLAKLGLTDRTQAALYAVREGLADA